MVLVRPAERRVEQERLTLLRPGRKRSWSMPRWIGRTFSSRHAEPLDERPRRVVRDRDHEPARRTVQP